MTSLSLKAVIFDMDGILIDSEPMWQTAEYEVLTNLGLNLNHSDILQTTGLRIDQVVSYWYQNFPWDNYDNEQTSKLIVDQVLKQILTSGRPMNGVIQALDFCRENGLKIGLTTSSSHAIVKATLAKLNIKHFFDSINSAEYLAFGKPHPEVYLNCAHDLNINPTQCIAIEDSLNGLIAARAASMQTIAIPAIEQQHESKWIIAHKQLVSLTDLPKYLTDELKLQGQ
ncbi:hexitol phosphatase HxpB [Shewanella sp. D64]|uniref:hexitol phosphatase HxpB n=1 Tax=unclassified Shewanella TaxID=196818 RepID=UPI0022BA42DC|nr:MULTISPECIES: hexitol phosphatase HxpB [unclassified Shewanella]MEC4728374.1 hexitol phosphatase HxpB [Shewanella sp. D64]MEC4740407.1 hexitol phosphatase HxpB [Shewanella sp. E94]WBJ95077.1 hexitol phosphatase HxpB [Shewanella sp. MTB7]